MTTAEEVVRFHLEIADHRGTRGQLALRPGSNGVGRDSRNTISLEGPFVSRHHARILLDQREVTVEDAGSHNGLFVNGRKAHAARLQAGDVICLGTYKLTLHATTGDVHIGNSHAPTDPVPAVRARNRPQGVPHESGRIAFLPAVPGSGVEQQDGTTPSTDEEPHSRTACIGYLEPLPDAGRGLLQIDGKELSRFYATVAEITARTGGRIDATFGAGALLLFDDRGDGSTTVRALSAVVQIAAALGSSLEATPALRAGLDYGTVRTGVVGNDPYRFYVLGGAPVWTAARITELAGTWQLVCTGRARSSLGDLGKQGFVALGPHVLRDRSTVFELFGANLRAAPSAEGNHG